MLNPALTKSSTPKAVTEAAKVEDGSSALRTLGWAGFCVSNVVDC